MGTSYTRKARTVRLPPVTDLQINSFNTGVVNTTGSYLYNAIVLRYPDGSYYATQRPSFSIFNQPSDEGVSDLRGRGISYWNEVDALYFVNNDTVYKDTYLTPLSNLFTAGGTEKVEIAELADKLVFLDAQGNEMWYVDSGDDTALVSMQTFTDSEANDIYIANADSSINTNGSMDFSTLGAGDTITVSGTSSNDGTYTIATVAAAKITVTTSVTDEGTTGTPIVGPVVITSTNYDALPQNNSLTLAHGLVVLDQTMYVLATDGTIWGSALGDVQDWDDGLNVITAEKEEDTGIYIAKHHNNIVVFGRRTIEFMYDAGNTVGSPLAIREDISYNIGCADANSVWRNGDEIYFLGIDTSGQIQPYLLKDYQIAPISNTSLSSFLTIGKSKDSVKTIGSGMSAGGVTYYTLTMYTLDVNGDIDPSATYVYNSDSKIWTEWEFAGTGIDNLPLVNYTITDDSRIGEGILAKGELVYAIDNYTPYDAEQEATESYVLSGYVGADYVLEGVDASSNIITMIIRLDNFDNDNRDWKYAHQLRFVGDGTQSSNDLTVRWADANNVEANYTAGRTIDLSSNLNKLTRLGRFKSRSFELEYTGTEQIRVKGIDLDITEGTH